jgi:LysR family transcriptional regulator, low CO2-responsive transcriptional regulator
VIDNSVDFGVVSTPDDKRLTVVTIHRDELVIIAPPGHPLSRMKEAAIADVVRFPLLLPIIGRATPLKTCSTSAISSRESPWRWIQASYSSGFVAVDVGVGFIARSNVIGDVKAGVLAQVPIADASIRRELALVFRKDKALSRAALAFIEIAVKLKPAQAL